MATFEDELWTLADELGQWAADAIKMLDIAKGWLYEGFRGERQVAYHGVVGDGAERRCRDGEGVVVLRCKQGRADGIYYIQIWASPERACFGVSTTVGCVGEKGAIEALNDNPDFSLWGAATRIFFLCHVTSSRCGLGQGPFTALCPQLYHTNPRISSVVPCQLAYVISCTMPTRTRGIDLPLLLQRQC
jgi:hypothetical protein